MTKTLALALALIATPAAAQSLDTDAPAAFAHQIGQVYGLDDDTAAKAIGTCRATVAALNRGVTADQLDGVMSPKFNTVPGMRRVYLEICVPYMQAMTDAGTLK